MLFSESNDKVAPALFSALEDPPSLVRQSEGQSGGRKYLYVELPVALEILRPHLWLHDLVILQPSIPTVDASHVGVRTVLLHKSGQWAADEGLFLPMGKTDPQGAGSAITYARRYGLLALLGLAQEDDDGAAASQSFPAASQEPVASLARPAAIPSVPPEVISRIPAAIVGLAEAQGRNGEAALTWAQGYPQGLEAAARRAVRDAAKSGMDREAVKKILDENLISDLIDTFGATEIPS